MDVVVKWAFLVPFSGEMIFFSISLLIKMLKMLW